MSKCGREGGSVSVVGRSVWMMSGGHQGSEYNLWKMEQEQVAFRRKDLVASPPA